MEFKEILIGLKVLYVEDEEATLHEMSRFLKKRVGKLICASNGIEALEIIKNDSFDLLITDLQMPDMDGIELLKALRESKNNIPAIITSAFSDSDNILQAVDLGIVKYCIKPIKTSELLTNMEKIATDILISKGEIIINHARPIDKTEKNQIEREIGSEMAHYVKATTGKGPKCVNVFISPHSVEVNVMDGLTIFETTMVKNPSNSSLVGFVRETYYKDCSRELEKMIGEKLDAKVKMLEINIEPMSRKDQLLFKII